MADINIRIDKEPELPEFFRDAKRNHGGQTVPSDFFDCFEKKINAMIDADVLVKAADKQAQKPQIQWYRNRRTLMGLAASFVLIVVVGLAFHVDNLSHKLQENTTANQFADFEDFYLLPESEGEYLENTEDIYLATTNDYELYEYYCEI